MSSDTTKYPYPPLLVFKMPDGEVKTKNQSVLKEINVNKIINVTVYKSKTAGERYGTNVNGGVIVVEMKDDFIIDFTDTTNVNLAQIEINSKSVKDINLPVYVDSIYVKYPEDVYLKKSEIKSVTENVEEVSGVKFINLLTYKKIIGRKPQTLETKPLKPGTTIWLRGNQANLKTDN